jgi:cytochrome b561
MDQIQLNNINMQVQIEAQIKACVEQLESATQQIQEATQGQGGQHMYVKTRDALGGLVVALLVLYIQKSINSKPVSKLTYTKALRHIHLLMGVGIIGGIGSVQKARYLEPGAEKKMYMDLHKSSGVLMLLAGFLRVVLRLRSNAPERFPSIRPLQFLETFSHRAFYLLMFALPTSGLAYSWYSGVKLPVLGFEKPAVEEEDGEKAQMAMDLHKKLGQFLEYAWLPFHFITLGYHSAKGRSVVKRITPFP